MRGKKASLAILLLATLLAAFAATGTASAATYASGTVSGDQISYDGGTNWESLSDAAAAGDTVGDVTVDGTLPVTIPEGLKVTGSIYNDKDVLLTVNGEQELSAENTNGIDAEGKDSNVNFRNLKSLTASSDGSDINGIYADSESSVDVAMSGKISAGAGGSYVRANGVEAQEGSYVKISGATGISATGLNASDDDYSDAYAIVVNNSTVKIDMSGNDADITAAGKGEDTYARGIYADGGSSVDVYGVNDISVSAVDAYGEAEAWGIYAEGSSVDISMNGNMTVKTTGDEAYGIYADTDDNTPAVVKFAGMKAMNVSADNGVAYGIKAYGSNVSGSMDSMAVTGGDDAYGIYADTDDNTPAVVKFAGMKAMNVSADNGVAYGIKAYGSNVSGNMDSMAVTGGDDAYGIKAGEDSSVDIALTGDMTVTGKGDDAYGIRAEDGDVNIALTGGMTVTGKGDDAYGIAAFGSNVSGSMGSMAMTASEDAYGISSYGSSVDIALTGGMTVTSNGGSAYGIEAYESEAYESNVSGSMGSMAVTASDDAYGISSYGSSVDIALTGGMTVTSNSGSAYGIAAYESNVSGSMGSIAVTASDNAYGISSYYGSSVDIALTGGMTVTSKGGSAYGIAAIGSNVSGNMGSMAVTASDDAYGIEAMGGSVDIALTGGMTVTSKGGSAYGIEARGSNVSGSMGSMAVTASDDAYGIEAMGGSVDIALTGGMTVTSKGGSAYGIAAIGSNVSGNMGSMAVTASDDAYGIEAMSRSVDATMTGDMTVKGSRSSTAIDAEYGSTVTVTGAARHKIAIDSEVSTDSVLRLSNGSTINVSNADVLNLGGAKVNSITAENYFYNSDSNNVVNASNSYIKGDVAFYDASGEDSESYTGPSFVTGVSSESGSGSLTVNLKDGSTLEGAANAYDGYAPGITRLGAVSTSTGVINFNVDNASKWLVTGDSNLGKGTLANNGTVAFSEDGAFKTVYVNKLAGVNGVYEMSTNGTNSDQIIAETKDSSASGVIHASAKSGVAATYQKRVATPFITVKNEESTSFTLAGGSFALGAWNYVLKSGLTAGGETEWFLASDPQNPVSPLALAATAAVVMPDVWYLETNALYSQANSFNADREDTTVWGQAVYNKTEWDNAMSAEGAAAGLVNADGNEVTQKFYGLTGGIDKRIKTDKGQWFAGWMIGYGEGDLDFTGGDGDLDSFHTGLYTVYRTDNDWYLAALAKYNSYKTSVTARANNAAYDGEYTQNGWGLSFLAGKQFVKESGWYLEPQFELGWHRTAGADYELAGLPVDVESMTSLRARAGLGFGRKRVYDNGRSLEFFVRASVVKEFDGDTNVRFFADQTKTAFDPFKVDYSGTWGQYKLGLNYYAPDKGFTLHGALTYENGGDRESPVGLELGGSWNIGPKAEEETEK